MFILYTICDFLYQVTIDILRRHANILNELGVLYMNKAASIASTFGVPQEAEIKLWKISYNYFEKGIKTFDAINDRLENINDYLIKLQF